MIDGLRPYPEYKESGQVWLGKIPEHWELPRLGAVLRERGETNESRQVKQVLSVLKDIGVIPYEEKGNVGNKKSEDIGRYKVVRPNDIVVNSMNVIIGSVGLSRYTGCLSPVYYVLTHRSSEDEPQFLNAVFQTKHFQKSLIRIGKGILAHRMRIPMELLKCEPFPLPPGDEQSAIVKFLDQTTRKLNRTIRTKQKVIALLNEQKQVIIHHAVTRGLDPNVPLKPSSIPWPGDVPKHWNLWPLKRLLKKMDYGTSLNLGREGKIRILTMGHIQDGEIVLPEHGSLDEVPLGLCLEENDLLFNRTNSPALVGKVGLFRGTVEDNITFASYLVRLRTRPEHSPFWLNYLLNSVRFWAYARSHALLSLHQANLNSTRYGQMILPIPPKSEQDQIAEYIFQQEGEIRHVIGSKKKEIDLLQEFRTRLIADVVTGKLDVREAARRIPDETEVADFEVEKVELSNGSDNFDSPGLTGRNELDEIDSNISKYGTGANQ